MLCIDQLVVMWIFLQSYTRLEGLNIDIVDGRQPEIGLLQIS